MSDSERDRHLVYEESNNGRFMSAMRKRAERRVARAGPRNVLWTQSSTPQDPRPEPHPLVGRVRLSHVDDFLESDEFYIGSWHHEDEGLRVFSWAARIASTFFIGGSNPHELLEHVIARRTLVARGGRIVDFADEWTDDASDGELAFSLREGLNVPKPPKAAKSRRPARSDAETSSQPSAGSTGDRAWRADGPASPQGSRTRAARGTGRRSSPQSLRAESALVSALEAPRKSRLTSVLATLQPDQYDLVTRPESQPLVIQGHPGTGKTIVAAHRSAYLVHEEGPRLQAVLLVGPTPAYSRHVQHLLASLDTGGRVVLRDVQTWLAELALVDAKGLKGRLDGNLGDVEWEAGRIFQDAAQAVRASRGGPGGAVDRAQLIWETVRANGVDGRTLTADPERMAWARSLPNFDRARTMTRYLPLLAQCALVVRGPKQQFEHIVVDEAQDVRPLEWRILDAHNRSERWTLLGDMNQRRTDHTHMSWQRLADDLGLSDPDVPFKPVEFRRGYRSTRPIMKFANRLLPKGDRVLENIQADGPEPTRKKVHRDHVAVEALRQAEALAHRYQHGTTAIITVDADSMVAELRRNGWRGTSATEHTWSKNRTALHLLKPDVARGVEFDAVLVVEPSRFPQNFGRHGPLYTSLTRANRELAIVHAEPLPDALRRR